MPDRLSREQLLAGSQDLRAARPFLIQVSIATGVVLVAMILSVAASHRMRVARARNAVANGEMGRMAREAELLALDRETAVRGYLITHDERSLEPEIRGRPLLATKLDSLDALSRETSSQHSSVTALEASVARWQDLFAEPTVRQARAGAIPSLDSTLAGKTLFDSVRTQFDGIVRDQDRRYANGLAAVESSRFLWSAVMLVEILVLVTLLFLLRARLRRLIGRVTSQHAVLATQNDQLLEQRDQLEAQAVELETTIQELQDGELRLAGVTSRLVEAQQLASIGSWEVEGDTGVQAWSDEMYRLFELEPAGHAPASFVEHVHPEDRDRVAAALTSILDQGGEFIAEARVVRRDGSVRMVSAHGSAHHNDDGQLRVSGTVQDVTDQKRVEAELRETGELLRTLLDSAPIAIVATDASLQVVAWNPAAERLFGWTAAEVMGRRSPLIQDAYPNDSRELRARAVANEQVMGVRVQRARKDGSTVDVSVSMSAHHDQKGNPAGYVALLTDLTDRLALEAQFRQAQKMEAVGRLAGGVAHDFNNLLTVISGYGDLLMMADDRTEDDRASLLEIRHAVDRAAALTRQLLAFSRQQVLQPRVLALNDTIEQTGKMLRRVLGEDIFFETQLAPDVGHVSADPGQIEQVLMNLAVNARDAMPTGGRLRIETANARLDESSLRLHPDVATPGEYVVLTIGDTGVGMPVDVRERIFEPFFTTKALGKGTGLGLSTVHGIVEQSGGHIFVYSEVGRGTTFRIYLPRHEASGMDDEQTPTPAEELEGSESILLVEDDAAVRGVTRAILTRAGYSVVEGENGRDALAIIALADRRIDLVLTDVVMPGMGGPELARRIHALRPGLLIIFMSGHTRAMISSEDFSADVSFIEKPFSTPELLGQLREMLGRRTRAEAEA